MTILKVEGLTHQFNAHTALKNISFEVKKGEIVGIIGSSGAGKSTLLRCLCALERPREGHIFLDGADLTALNEEALVATRRKVGLVFQHFNLLNSRNVAENIALPLQISGWSPSDIARRVEELITLVGLRGHEHKRLAQLSGGQKQRVGIARAIAGSPSLLLCDEATSALDPDSTTAILELLSDINHKLGLTIILITHEMDVVRRFAHRVIVLDQGAIIRDGSMSDLLREGLRDPRLGGLLTNIRPRLPEAVAHQLCDPARAGAVPIVRLVVTGERSETAFLSELTRRFNQDALLIAGGAFQCGGEIIIDMIVQLSRPMTTELKTYLDTITHVTEILGHVSSHR